jgi:hypothetical protein
MIKEGNAHKELEKLHIQTIEALRAKIDNIEKEVNLIFCPTNGIIFFKCKKCNIINNHLCLFSFKI